MYSIPNKAIVQIEPSIEEKIAAIPIPNQRNLIMIICALLLLFIIGFFFASSTGLFNKAGNVAGVNTEDKKLFEELRSMPQYSKMFSELARNKSYKNMVGGKFTIVVIQDENLGNSALNIEDYILFSEFSDESQRLISLSDKRIQMTKDGFGTKKLNDKEIVQEYKFNTGSIIEISRKY